MHRISFLAIELLCIFTCIIYLAVALRDYDPSLFAGNADKGESPQVCIACWIDDIHFEVSKRRTWFWELAMLEVVKHVIYVV